MDGLWVSPIVDHMCILLLNYAKAADHETMKNPYQMKQQSPDATPSDSAQVQSTISLMENLFRTLQSSAKQSNDNRKQSSFFCVLHMIRASFMINQFYLCERFFKLFDRPPEGVDLKELPKSWQVQAAFYQGRYHMYNNSFDKARHELRKAFSLCHRDHHENKQRIMRYLVPVEMLVGKFPS
jgi:hypothetical protein